MHSPQLVQISGFILAKVPSNVIASTEQTFAHFLHILYSLHCSFLTIAPLSKLLHATVYSLHFGVISIIPLGHAATHFSQVFTLRFNNFCKTINYNYCIKRHALTQFPNYHSHRYMQTVHCTNLRLQYNLQHLSNQIFAYSFSYFQNI